MNAERLTLQERAKLQPNLYRVVEELCKCPNPKKMAYRLAAVISAGALDSTLTLSDLKTLAEKEGLQE